jgi:hypothetical protein
MRYRSLHTAKLGRLREAVDEDAAVAQNDALRRNVLRVRDAPTELAFP